jgi:hypothetical protein
VAFANEPPSATSPPRALPTLQTMIDIDRILARDDFAAGLYTGMAKVHG